ncbi:hypothetical protein DFH08DRAFT_730163 [Mycena albidolilacea]|uniref:Uncharacterized protein n=1 Tax=Mycena albidolilacea TaxID=1033008 RepID=A0AAD7AMZ3_9AGAR|nr:hypothetical protein DFH08DRAFT_730163 [Mycena albidolilacea]
MINLLTDTVVKTAASEENKIGESVSLNWPLNFLEKPMFEHKLPKINMKIRNPESSGVRDKIHIFLNMACSTTSLVGHCCVTRNPCEPICSIPTSTLPHGILPLPNLHQVDPVHARIGIQSEFSTLGICGRGMLLDLYVVPVLWKYILTPLIHLLSSSLWSMHPISVHELEESTKAQGVKFSQGDILILYVGWGSARNTMIPHKWSGICCRPEQKHFSTGIEQSEEMKCFLWNNHFVATASDQPVLEVHPPVPEVTMYVHQTILGLWGMPINEFFDLKKLNETCTETGCYMFFFSSWPLNIIGRCASPLNTVVCRFIHSPDIMI